MFALVFALTLSGTIELEDEVKLIAPTEDICLDSVEFHADQEVYIEGNSITFKNGGRYYGPKFHFKAKEGIYVGENGDFARMYDMEPTEWMATGVTVTDIGEMYGAMKMRGASVSVQSGSGIANCNYGGYIAGEYFSKGNVQGGIVFHNVTLEGNLPQSSNSTDSLLSCIWNCFKPEEKVEEEPEEETPETIISENIKQYIHWDEQE